MSPFDLTGGPFLTLYGALFAMALVAGFIIPRWLRPDGGSTRALDPEQLAWLAGGRDRVSDSVVARLLANGSLSLIGSKFDINAQGRGSTAAERSVLALRSPASWGKVDGALKRHSSAIEERLVASGLLIDGSTGWQMRFWQTLPYLLLIGFGAIKLDIGISRDRPVGFLTIFLVVTAVFALIRFLALDRRTRAAIEALSDARARSERLQRAPTPGEMDMAVALFGTAVLVGSGWAGFHQLRSASSGSDGGSSSSDGGGSSGCGGGGCGGCGS
jgi:uncharacterized protein (TIGR04222 family)